MKDFFISYTKVDEKKATWIAETLENEGYTTVIQAWDFNPGSNFVVEMQNALITCNKVIAVLSEAYFTSVFANPEWSAAFANDPMGQERKLIPIRVENFTPLGLMKTIVYIDLADLLDETKPHLENEAKEKLLTNIGGKIVRKSDLFSSDKKVNTDKIQFNFELHTNGIVPHEYLNRTKSQMRNWLFGHLESPVKVLIIDDKISELRKLKQEYEEKELHGITLSEEDESNYSRISSDLGYAENVKERKELAIEYMLGDTTMFGYMGIYTIPDLQEAINSIIKLRKSGVYEFKDGKCLLEIYNENAGFKAWYFKAEVSEDALYEKCGGNTTLHVRGKVHELGASIVKEILPSFYFFLADETINHKEISYEDRSNQEIFDIFKYSFGIA